MPDIRALLIDDEPVANEGLRALLRQHADVDVIGECHNAADAISQIRLLRPDLVFLDVQMPEADGFAVVRALEARSSPVIAFVTAHEEHALQAFDSDAIGYLLKPVADDKLDRLMQRVRRRLGTSRASRNGSELAALPATAASTAPAGAAPRVSPIKDLSPASCYLSRLTVRSGRRSISVPVSDIDWVAADDYCVNVVVKGRRHLLRASLTSLEAKLDPAMFIRVHRSALVNVSQVKEWHTTPLRRLILILGDGTRLRVSRSRKASMLALLRTDYTQRAVP